MAEAQILSPEDLSEQIWALLKRVKKREHIQPTIAAIETLIRDNPSGTAARAFDRLTRAVKFRGQTAPNFTGVADDDILIQSEIRYTSNVAGLLWDLYKRVSGNDVPNVNFENAEPSHWTRVLMEHFQRLHNIQMYKRIKGLGDDVDEAQAYDQVVSANLAKDTAKSNLKLSVSLRRVSTVSSLHWDLFGGRTDEDVYFFMPSTYLHAQWIRIRIDGAERNDVRFFEFPTVLSQFFVYSGRTLQTLELANLNDVQFVCDGNVMTSFVQGDEENGLVDIKYSTLGMAFPKMSSFKLLNLHSLACLTWDDVIPHKLLTIGLQGLSECNGVWDPVKLEWQDLTFSRMYKRLHTLMITGGHVSVVSVDCPKLTTLGIGSTKDTAPPGHLMFSGPTNFPILSSNMKLETLILRDGTFRSILPLHNATALGKGLGHSGWKPIFPTLTELQLVNINVEDTVTLREFSRLNSGTKGPRIVVWDNVQVQVDFQGGAGFQDGDQDPVIYGDVSPEVTHTILRRMLHCTNLTIAREHGEIDLAHILMNNRKITTLQIVDVPNAKLVLPEHTANSVVSITRPDITFDSHSEVILQRRGAWRAGGTWVVASADVNPVSPARAPMHINVDLPGEGLDPEIARGMVIDEIQRIEGWLGPIDRDTHGNHTPRWVDPSIVDNDQLRTQFLSWEETVLRWFTRSMASDDLVLPFYEGISMDFTFGVGDEGAQRTMSRHVGANMFQTVMNFDDESQGLFHDIAFLPDEDVLGGYVANHQQRLAEMEEEAEETRLANEQLIKQGATAEPIREPEPLKNPEMEAREAIEVNRPALLNALERGQAGIQFRIRAGPRHEGWAFVSADPGQNAEEVGVGATTLTFDHTFTFNPFDEELGRGYVMQETDHGFDVMYRDVHLSENDDAAFELPMGRLARTPEGTFRFSVGCQTLMALIGLRSLESMAFVSTEVILQENVIRKKLEQEGVLIGADLENMVKRLMVTLSSPQELGNPLWMTDEGEAFKVIPTDFESTTLYQEVIDRLRVLMLGATVVQDEPFSQFRAHASNYLMLAYFMGRCMGNALTEIRANVEQVGLSGNPAISQRILDRFTVIYEDTWLPMMSWTSNQGPVSLSFDMTRAADLFQNLKEIFALVQSMRKFKVPRVTDQSEADRKDVLENRRNDIFALYGKLVAGIQVLFDPHMYELMYDSYQKVYNTMMELLDVVLEAYMDLDDGGQADPSVKGGFRKVAQSTLSAALEGRIAELFQVIDAFFTQAFEEEEEEAFEMSEGSPSDQSPEGRMPSPSPPPSPGIVFSRSPSPMQESPGDNFQDTLITQLALLSAAETEEERRALEERFLRDMQSRIMISDMLVVTESAAAPLEFVTPVRSKKKKKGVSKFIAPMADIVAEKRRASASPESLRNVESSPPEAFRRESTASGGVFQSEQPMSDARRAALLRREFGARLTGQTQLQNITGSEELRTIRGVSQAHIGVQSPPPLIVDRASPLRSTKKRAKVAPASPLSTAQKKRAESTRRKRQEKTVQPQQLDFYRDPKGGGGSFSTRTNAKVCANCGDRATNRCSLCKAVFYCGRECQTNHFLKHVRECK
jgi:hypothetical protein